MLLLTTLFLLIHHTYATNPIDVINPIDTIEVIEPRTAEDPYRLETTVLPTHYDLTLRLEDNFGPNASFTGTVSIDLQVVGGDVAEVTLHANQLVLETVSLVCEGRELYGGLRNETEYHMVTVEATESIVNGSSCVLKFEDFVGVLGDDMYGFYRSKYENEEGVTEWLATTQFQTTRARRAFPCFDEPSFKATFQVKIYHPSDYHAVSNTPLVSSETDATSGLILDTFEVTPKMSTYLLAFIVSKFAYLEDSARKSRVYARSEDVVTAAYSLTVTPAILAVLENMTGIEYLSTGIGKLDQFAIPDFSAGAMENWGIITYRERNILWDPEHSSNAYKQAIAAVITHELAHMWFGNLVTCQWWSYTWLNEGFARYFQYFGTGEVEPSWEMDKQFVTAQQQVIFASDALASAEALTSNASSPTEVSNKFSSISYNKGASIIRMVKHFMGYDNWKTGIQEYLEARKFDTALPEHLINSWANHASSLPEGRTFSEVMKTWTEEPGYPVLTVEVSDMDVIITQKRFFLNTSETSSTKWDIPITYTTSDLLHFEDTTPILWFPATSDNITISHVVHDSDHWIILNVQETAYYRVNYDDQLWSAIEAALKSDNFGGIHVLNRAQIVDDIINLARAGEVTYRRALAVLSYLENETEYYPWYAAFQGFSYLNRRIGGVEELGDRFHSFLMAIMEKVLESIPFEDIRDYDQTYTLNKVQVWSWACVLGHEECISKSLSSFHNYHHHQIYVNANLRNIVYCNALRHSNTTDEWYFLYNTYLETKLSTEEVTIISALGCTQNADLINEYIRKIMTTEDFRTQDISTIFSSIYGQTYGVTNLYNFLKENYKELSNYYSSWASLFSSCAERFTTEEQISDLEAFLTENESDLGSSAATTIRNAISSAKVNLEWTSGIRADLEDFFTAFENSAVTVGNVVVTTISALVVMFLVR